MVAMFDRSDQLRFTPASEGVKGSVLKEDMNHWLMYSGLYATFHWHEEDGSAVYDPIEIPEEELPELLNKWTQAYTEFQWRAGAIPWHQRGSSALLNLSTVPVAQLQQDAMTVLDLTNSDLGVGEAVLVAGMMSSSVSLTFLDLSSNHLTNIYYDSDQPNTEGLFALADAIAPHECIKTVRLACCGMCGKLITSFLHA